MNFRRNRLINKNFRAVGVVKYEIFPSFSPISQTSNPLRGLSHHHELGRYGSYVHAKFGRNLPVNKNFRPVGVVKNVISPSFSLMFQMCNPLWGLPHHHPVERAYGYTHIKFGQNRPVNKNFRALGVWKNSKFPFLERSDPFFSTSHRRRRGRAADNLSTNFGQNRFVNKIFCFLGVVRPLFQKFHQRPQEHPIGYPCTRIGENR